MRPFLERPAANPSSQHGPGRAARAAVETAREQVAALVGAAPSQVVFTSGGTEADNLAVKGTVLAREPGGRQLVASAVEHHAVLHAAEWAVAEAGASLDLAPVDQAGRVELDGLAAVLRPGRTALDAVQAAGAPGVDLNDDGADLLALAAHKLGGPTGVGALVVRPGLDLHPLLHGGGQERGLRSGTMPAAALAGFGAAADLARAERASHGARLTRLRERLLGALLRAEPALVVNGDPGGDAGSPRRASLPGLLSVRFPGRRAEDLLLLLDRAGVACSSGSACASGAVRASHVLLALGRAPAEAREARSPGAREAMSPAAHEAPAGGVR